MTVMTPRREDFKRGRRGADVRVRAGIRGRRGQALVPVLFLVVILTAYVVVVSTTARREVKAAANHLRETQEHYVAQGAVQYAIAQLQQVTNGGAIPPQLTQPPDTDANGWTALGEGWYRVELIDTASRLNINTADMSAIGTLPQVQNDPSLAPAIVDWRDADDSPTVAQNGSGAESDYYQALSPPYSARNGPFDTIDELLLVRGFSPQLLYQVAGQTPIGLADTNANPLTSRAGHTRQGAGDQTGTVFQVPESNLPLSELLTTYSKEANVAADGTKRINIRMCTQQQLTDVMTKADVSQQLARQVVQTFFGPVPNPGGGGGGQGQQQTQQSQVTSLADLLGKPSPDNTRQLVTAWRQEVLQKVADYLTATDDAAVTNVININTAPMEVLGTLPGMDQALFDALQGLREQGTPLTSVNDLFQGNTFTRRQLQVLYGHVCTKSSVYLVRVRVRMNGSARVYASEALVELAPPQDPSASAGGSGAASGTSGGATQITQSTTPTILQWREVPRTPGWTGWAPAPNYYQ